MTTTGCCLCGAIQFEFAGEAVETTHCHCESCRGAAARRRCATAARGAEVRRRAHGRAKLSE